MEQSRSSSFISRIELRQAFGLLALLAIGLVVWLDPSLILRDFDGVLGLLLPLAIGMAVPRRWLPITFHLIAMYLMVIGTYWLVLDLRGQAKSSLYWIAFFFAAGVLILCGRVATRASSVAK